MPRRRATDAQVKTLLVSDLVASTRLTERLGDRRASRVFARQDRAARDLLVQHHGLEIDKTDGFLLLFERPIRAVQWALAYHEALAEISKQVGVELAARVGIHVGEVVLRRNPPDDVARGAKPLEVEGLAKAKAARLMSLAGARQTLLTGSAFALVERAAAGSEVLREGLRSLAYGDYLFQGIRKPTPVFEVGIEGFAPLAAPADSEKVRRLEVEIADPGWRPGTEVPRRPHWVLEEKLGERSSCETWVATHGKTHERRVFKLCCEARGLQALQHEVTLFRLLNESLGHRGDLARILDWDFDEPPFFLESEYTDDGHLGEWLAAQGGSEVPLESRLEIAAQVAEALAAAHSAGVLHKDVAPANILIHRDPAGSLQARLSNFGIGLASDEERFADADVTMMLSPLAATDAGTPLYTAPELTGGKTPTAQADVYSLGVLLYQLVVGDLSRPLAPGWEAEIDDPLLRRDVAEAVSRSPGERPDARELCRRLRSLDRRRRELETDHRAGAAAQRGRGQWERMTAALLWIVPAYVPKW